MGRAILKLTRLYGHFYEDHFSAKDAVIKDEQKENKMSSDMFKLV